MRGSGIADRACDEMNTGGKAMTITDSMRKAVIFQNLSDSEIEGMLPCLNGKEQKFEKNEVIYRPGDAIRRIGLVVSGAVRIEKIDYWGNRKILSVIEPGQIFGEAYAGMKTVPMEMEVLAAVPTTVLFLEIGKILTTCGNSCEFHSKMIRMLQMSGCCHDTKNRFFPKHCRQNGNTDIDKTVIDLNTEMSVLRDSLLCDI